MASNEVPLVWPVTNPSYVIFVHSMMPFSIVNYEDLLT